ncbi:hypothetical protein [Pontiella sulfatireligans]|uniref:Uncharacterized protein n=1 Tax=Pontiella sulfatireligans TaxID=2750658 RepID=A0A6C2UTF8_9BACT|nr:hypothetical protein [Pontiella sulfatireligans]VGO22561.1 hypothetical protein SCARR_04646 [Pontiella sulfatireligans]
MSEVFEPGTGVQLKEHSPIMVFSGIEDENGHLQCLWHNDSGHLQEYYFHPEILIDMLKTETFSNGMLVEIGSVVSLGVDHWAPGKPEVEMLVTGLNGGSAICLWFIDQRCVIKEIPLASLVVPRQVKYGAEEKPEIGSNITLPISSAPSMTLASIDEEKGDCLWFLDSKDLVRGVFPVSLLLPVLEPSPHIDLTEYEDGIPF